MSNIEEIINRLEILANEARNPRKIWAIRVLQRELANDDDDRCLSAARYYMQEIRGFPREEGF